MLKRLDTERHRALVIYMDGTYRFGATHSGINVEFMNERGFYPEDKDVIGFYEVNEYRQVSSVAVLNENKSREILESKEFIDALRSI